MNRQVILNLILIGAVTALLVMNISGKKNKSNQGTTNTSEMVLKNIYTRTSVRSYEGREIEKDKVEQMLRAAMSAPTAMNKQPWAFIVVNDRAVLNSLADSLPHAKMAAEAPVAIVVCGDLSKVLEGEASTYWIQDASAATENLLLAAHGLGLGAVWTGVYPNQRRVEAVKAILNLPENIIPLNVIPVGYPKGPQAPKDKWNTDNIHYNKW
ncbi:MAG TPA: nitroreductase family protein [Bacteroidales bacterium]|nr:nitroreductase family protein [Bacteroidales bacterium]